jgi:hypothetical protein
MPQTPKEVTGVAPDIERVVRSGMNGDRYKFRQSRKTNQDQQINRA